MIAISIFILGLTTASFAQLRSATDVQTKLMKFYPSPATTTIIFEFQHGYDKSYSLQLYNFMGKQVYETKTLNSRMVISLSDLFRGIYIYQLRDRTGQILESGKFQIIK